MFELDGRTALVTGAGRGVGAGIAEVLADQGARVVVNDLDTTRAGETVEALVARGADAADAVFDVTDERAVREAVAEIGVIDILVNNAGIPTAGMPQLAFADTDPELWRRFVDLNLYGPLHCLHAVLPGMRERGHGRVVTISSEAGRMGLGIGVSLYGGAKAGAVGVARHVAVEVAPFGITVNTLSLGLMDNVPAEFSAALVRGIPCGRLGSPRDVGAAVAFLASDEAGWITGQVLPVNGGVYAS